MCDSVNQLARGRQNCEKDLRNREKGYLTYTGLILLSIQKVAKDPGKYPFGNSYSSLNRKLTFKDRVELDAMQIPPL